MKSESEHCNPLYASRDCPGVNLNHEIILPNNRILLTHKAWQNRLGKLNLIREIDCETAAQELVKAPVYGPVEIRVEGFPPVYGEVLFLDMWKSHRSVPPKNY